MKKIILIIIILSNYLLLADNFDKMIIQGNYKLGVPMGIDKKYVPDLEVYLIYARGTMLKDANVQYLRDKESLIKEALESRKDRFAIEIDENSFTIEIVPEGVSLFAIGISKDFEYYICRGDFLNPGENLYTYYKIPRNLIKLESSLIKPSFPEIEYLKSLPDEFIAKTNDKEIDNIITSLDSKIDNGLLSLSNKEFLIYVSLDNQKMYLFQYFDKVFNFIRATKISSGKGEEKNKWDTPKGIFNRRDNLWRETDMSVENWQTKAIEHFDFIEDEKHDGKDRASTIPTIYNKVDYFGPAGCRRINIGAVNINKLDGDPYILLAIHGTKYECLLGQKASQGCIRASFDFINILDDNGILDDYGKYIVIDK